MSGYENLKEELRERISDEPAYQKWKKQDGRKGTFGYRKVARVLGQILTGQFRAVRVETRKERKQIRRARRKALEQQNAAVIQSAIPRNYGTS